MISAGGLGNVAITSASLALLLLHGEQRANHAAFNYVNCFT